MVCTVKEYPCQILHSYFLLGRKDKNNNLFFNLASQTDMTIADGSKSSLKFTSRNGVKPDIGRNNVALLQVLQNSIEYQKNIYPL